MPVTLRSGNHAQVEPAPKTKGKRGATSGSQALAKDNKRIKKEKDQKTIEEVTGNAGTNKYDKEATENGEMKPDRHQNGTKDSPNDSKQNYPTASKPIKSKETKVEKSPREASPGSTKILESGIIYILIRPRVNTPHPHSLPDIARSHIVLRPLPPSHPSSSTPAEISSGSLDNTENLRLLALPKKSLPRKKERFLAFVERANVGIQELKESFFKSTERETQKGTSHYPPPTPIAEGVYAITSTVSSTNTAPSTRAVSHLTYHLTLPSPETTSSVQDDLHIPARATFLLSVKNPSFPPSGNNPSQGLAHGAEYSPEILEAFKGLRWISLGEKGAGVGIEALGFERAQVMLLGVGVGNVGQKGEEGGDEDEVVEELEKLEEEDQERVEHLGPGDAILADLGLDSKLYPNLQTTW